MTKNTNGILILVIVIVLAVIGYSILTMPDNRSPAEKVGDAISELPNGPDRAVDQLKDRTPGERVGEAVQDMGDSIKENTDR